MTLSEEIIETHKLNPNLSWIEIAKKHNCNPKKVENSINSKIFNSEVFQFSNSKMDLEIKEARRKLNKKHIPVPADEPFIKLKSQAQEREVDNPNGSIDKDRFAQYNEFFNNKFKTKIKCSQT